MRDIFGYLWRYRFKVFLGLLSLGVVDTGSLIIPLIIRQAIDELALGFHLRYAFYIVGIALVIMVFRFFWRYFLMGSAIRVEQNLRDRLYAHLLRLSSSFYNETKTGDLMAHATNDVEAVRRACGFGILALADAFIIVPFTIAIMLWINPILTMYALIPLPLITLLMLGFGRVIHRRFEAVQEVFSKVMEKVRESLAGIRVVKSFVQEEGMNRDFDEVNRLFVNKNMRLVRIWGFFNPLISLLSGLSIGIVLWMGGRGVISQTISIGDFVAFSQYLMMLTWPMMALGWAVNLIQRGAASMNRINKILETEPQIKETKTNLKTPKSGRIEFKNLSFSYNGQPVLKDINLVIEEGATLGIVGMVGSGKSTLTYLIPRIFDPPPRTVFIDGVDIRDMKLKDLRSKIGMVPQDPFLFSTTIAENIRFGRPSATDAQVEKAAKLAGIYDEIMEFPGGFDTLVGERGVSLSGGQKQRIAIARAILLNPMILILDDALSSVDAEREEMILRNLRDFLTGRTSIVISHRISAVKDSTEIIVLDRGRIAETGSHEELIENGGIYARIWQFQQVEMKLKRQNP
jgi:ATP-binding cassette subfamily B protein